MLVPQTDAAGPTDRGVRRYNLARLGTASRSALGEDRHERLERVAGMRGVYAAQPARALPPRANGSELSSNGSAPATNGSTPPADGLEPAADGHPGEAVVPT